MADVAYRIVNILTKIPIKTLEEKFSVDEARNITRDVSNNSLKHRELLKRVQQLNPNFLNDSIIFRQRICEALARCINLSADSIKGNYRQVLTVLEYFFRTEQRYIEVNPAALGYQFVVDSRTCPQSLVWFAHDNRMWNCHLNFGKNSEEMLEGGADNSPVTQPVVNPSRPEGDLFEYSRVREQLSKYTGLSADSISGDLGELNEVSNWFFALKEDLLKEGRTGICDIQQYVEHRPSFSRFAQQHPLWDKCIRLSEQIEETPVIVSPEPVQEGAGNVYLRAQESTNIDIEVLKEFFTLDEAQLIPSVMRGGDLNEAGDFIRAGLMLFDILFDKKCVGILPSKGFRRPTNRVAAHVYSVKAELLHELCKKRKIREVWDEYDSLLENKKAFWNALRVNLGMDIPSEHTKPQIVTTDSSYVKPTAEVEEIVVSTVNEDGRPSSMVPSADTMASDEGRSSSNFSDTDLIDEGETITIETPSTEEEAEGITPSTPRMSLEPNRNTPEATDYFLHQKGLAFKDALKSIKPEEINFYTPRVSLGGLYELSKIYPTPKSLQLYIMHEMKYPLSVSKDELEISHQLNQSKKAKQCLLWLAQEQVKAVKSNSPLLNKMPSAVTFKENESAGYLFGNQEITRSFLDSTLSRTTCECVVSSKNNDASLALKEQMETAVPWMEIKEKVLDSLRAYTKHRSPEFIYYLTLWHLFRNHTESIFKDDTDLLNTPIWQKLFDFQRDGAISILNKLEKRGGCILADSVGLGKTYTALAVIMAYQRMGKNVAVFCPAQLERNWKRFQSTAIENPFKDTNGNSIFKYRLFRHTHLRAGTWEKQNGYNLNYSLIVIDESHNFRSDTGKRYRFLQKYLEENRNTKVLMLTATPINNHVKDLKNQLKLLWHFPCGLNAGPEYARFDGEIANVLDETHDRIKDWQEHYHKRQRNGCKHVIPLKRCLPEEYFALLKRYIVARNVAVIRQDYPQFIREKGNLPRENHEEASPGVSRIIGIHEIVREFENLKLVAYNQRDFFENNLTASPLLGMLKVGFLKRFESSVESARQTLNTLISYMERVREKILKQAGNQSLSLDSVDEDSVTDYVDVTGDEILLQARDNETIVARLDQVQAFYKTVTEDINKLNALKKKLCQVTVAEDLKLQDLKGRIQAKMSSPVKKVLVFTAYKDTANYLYENIRGMNCTVALVTGEGTQINNAMRGGLTHSEILARFAPIGQEQIIEAGRQINVLIATDCISEGQNLQDCDMVINYDIHWNPVRLTQRNGRINRIGSPHKEIQIVKYWPMRDIDEYLNVYTRIMTKTAISGTIANGATRNTEMEDVERAAFFQNQRLKEMLEADPSRRTLERAQEIKVYDTRPFLSDYSAFRDNKEMKKLFQEIEDAPLGLHAISKQPFEDMQPCAIFLLRKKAYDVNVDNEENYKFLMVHSQNGIVKLNERPSDVELLSLYQKCCMGKREPLSDEETKLERVDSSILEERLRKTLQQENLNLNLDKYTLATYLVIGDVATFAQR